MKNYKLLTITMMFIMGTVSTTIAQEGIGTRTPFEGAALDISSVNKGLLIPRVSLGSVIDMLTVTGLGDGKAEGMLVYNLNDTSPAVDGVVPGFYYYHYDGTSGKWINISSSMNNNIVNSNVITMYAGDTSITASDDTVLVNAELNEVVITLPAVSAVPRGKKFTIKKTDAKEDFAMIIRAATGEVIDGVSELKTSIPYQVYTVQNDGFRWFVVGE